jgi:hypothetical protein
MACKCIFDSIICANLRLTLVYSYEDWTCEELL